MPGRTLPLLISPRVLLPGTVLAFQIVRPERRQMVDQLEDGLVGVTLQADRPEGPPWHSVGTVGRVIDRHDLPDRSRLLVQGERRFEVIEFLSDDPYPIALVEFLADGVSGDRGLEELRRQVESALRRYLALIAESGEAAEVHVSLSGEAASASYEVASLMRISNPERQELLELPTAGARLDRELALLGREISLLERVLTKDGG